HHPLEELLLAQLEAQGLAAREDLAKRFAHLLDARQARAVGMDAEDVVVVGPDGHHGLEIAFGERLVEGRLGVLGRGEEHLLHRRGGMSGKDALEPGAAARAPGILSKSTAAKTRDGSSCIMQLKCPSGHSRRKHGLHGSPSVRMRASSESGGVYEGLLEPKSATSGRPSAAATCMRPESLLTTTAANDTSSMASSSVVSPHRLRLDAARPAMAAPASRSPAPPISQTASPRAVRPSASAATERPGQRLAGPYAR